VAGRVPAGSAGRALVTRVLRPVLARPLCQLAAGPPRWIGGRGKGSSGIGPNCGRTGGGRRNPAPLNRRPRANPAGG
jgi:hypothetical protein